MSYRILCQRYPLRPSRDSWRRPRASLGPDRRGSPGTPQDAAWEVRADITVSSEGVVEHVFLEQPLETAALNQSILRLLHGLRFKPGDNTMVGHIEVYSPGTGSGEGDNQ